MLICTKWNWRKWVAHKFQTPKHLRGPKPTSGMVEGKGHQQNKHKTEILSPSCMVLGCLICSVQAVSGHIIPISISPKAKDMMVTSWGSTIGFHHDGKMAKPTICHYLHISPIIQCYNASSTSLESRWNVIPLDKCIWSKIMTFKKCEMLAYC